MNNDFYTVRGYELKSNSKNEITPGMEDYIEMIYRHCLKQDYIRINQLSNLLNVSNASATKMVQKLADLSLVNYKKYSLVTLTVSGEKLGSFLLERHNTIEKFLIFIGCEEDVLLQTELIEHNISSETLIKIKLLLNFFNQENSILDQYVKYREKQEL